MKVEKIHRPKIRIQTEFWKKFRWTHLFLWLLLFWVFWVIPFWSGILPFI